MKPKKASTEKKTRFIVIKGKKTYLTEKDYKYWTIIKRLYGGYYDRDGKAISMLGWVKLIEEKGYEYKKVEESKLWLGLMRVSTIWLGLDHSFNVCEMKGHKHRPIIFETMVFGKCCGWSELAMNRYSTEDEAIAGHVEMVYEWSKLHHLAGHIWHEHIERPVVGGLQKLKEVFKR